MDYRYRKTTYRCSECKLSFDKTRKFSVDKYPHGNPLPFPSKDPECPQCKKIKRVNLKSSVTDDTHKHINPLSVEANFVGGTPESPVRSFAMGGTDKHKAFDLAAKITMEDHQMTDINMGNNLRPGDNCVPKLPAHLEQQVNSVFATQKNNVAGTQATSNLNRSLTAQINSGAFKDYGGDRDIVARQQKGGYTVPTTIIGEYNKRPPQQKMN